MHIAFDYDPSMHRLAELPVTDFLRRELGLPNVVTYFHDVWKDWNIALKEGHEMMDIGKLGDGTGKDTSLTHENGQNIIRRMKTLISRSEAKKRMKAHANAEAKAADERVDKYYDGVRKVHSKLKNSHGPMKADEWMHHAKGGVAAIKGE